MMQNNQIELLNIDNERTRKATVEMQYILVESQKIAKKFYASGVNNLNMELRKIYEYANKFAEILRQRTLWEEWLIVSQQQPSAFVCPVIVNRMKNNLSSTISQFYASTENKTYKTMSKFHSLGLQYKEYMESSESFFGSDFCLDIANAINSIEMMQERMQRVKQYMIFGMY